MAGFWHMSHHQMRDPSGTVYAGAKAYFFEAATLTPITVYQDYSLGTAHPNPVVANAYGVFPPVFLDEADSFYRQRVTTSGGVIIPGTDVGILPIIGPSVGEGGGAEVPVDPNALFQTGDPIWLPRSGTRTGWVRLNGRTIGSATSGASERANSDCEALFLYNWNNYTDTYCAVSGGRGASAAADWAANKTITLLSMRGRSPTGLGDMGNSDIGLFTGVPFGLGDSTTAAAIGGEARHPLTSAELASHAHSATVTDPGHAHTQKVTINAGGALLSQATTGGSAVNSATDTDTEFTGISVSVGSTGSNDPHNTYHPFMLGTFYQKL